MYGSGVPQPAATNYRFKDFPHSSHRTLIEWTGPGLAKALDVGTATGFLGHALTRIGHTVVGVEANPAWAQEAAPRYASFHRASVAELPVLAEAPFDVVIAGDVLEHVADPGAALSRLVAQMRTGGRLLVSVPNVAFLFVRLGLLAGRFEYRERGILDATHLRFFTRATLRRLLISGGLEIVRLIGVPPPLPLLGSFFARGPGLLVYEAANGLARFWPTLFAFQFVAEARR